MPLFSTTVSEMAAGHIYSTFQISGDKQISLYFMDRFTGINYI